MDQAVAATARLQRLSRSADGTRRPTELTRATDNATRAGYTTDGSAASHCRLTVLVSGQMAMTPVAQNYRDRAS